MRVQVHLRPYTCNRPEWNYRLSCGVIASYMEKNPLQWERVVELIGLLEHEGTIRTVNLVL